MYVQKIKAGALQCLGKGLEATSVQYVRRRLKTLCLPCQSWREGSSLRPRFGSRLCRSCLASGYHRQLPFIIICRVIKALSWNKLGVLLFHLISNSRLFFNSQYPCVLYHLSDLPSVVSTLLKLLCWDSWSHCTGQGVRNWGQHRRPSMVSHHDFCWAGFYCS